MARKPWGRVDLAGNVNAEEVLSAMTILRDSPGWDLLQAHLTNEARALRQLAGSRQISADSPAQLMVHNADVSRADAYEDIVSLVAEVIKQCKAKVEGERNAGT